MVRQIKFFCTTSTSKYLPLYLLTGNMTLIDNDSGELQQEQNMTSLGISMMIISLDHCSSSEYLSFIIVYIYVQRYRFTLNMIVMKYLFKYK